MFPSNINVTRGRYITSNDPRGYLPVYEYILNNQTIMMDSDDGYVLFTSICKALGKSKAEIAKMVESDPELPSRIRKVKGGFLKVQGTWIPHENAKALARKIAWQIREELVPLFGPEFPDICLAPNDPGFADILDSKRRARRNTQPAAPTPPSQGSPSGDYAPPWQSQSPVVPQRRETSYSEPGGPVSRQNTYSSQPPPSPTTARMPYGQQVASPTPPYNHSYPSGQDYQAQQPSYYSQSPSPTHIAREDSFGMADMRYTEAPYAFAAAPQQYQAYSNPYTTSSPTGYAQPPTIDHQQAIGRQEHRQAAPHITPSSSSDFSQPATPSQMSPYTPAEYPSYASHGVSSGYARQPCDTYQSQSQAATYGQQYPVHVADPNSQYQHTSPISPQSQAYETGRFVGGESNVRYEGYGDATGQAYQYEYTAQGSIPGASIQGGYATTPQGASGPGYRQSGPGTYAPGYDYQQG